MKRYKKYILLFGLCLLIISTTLIFGVDKKKVADVQLIQKNDSKKNQDKIVEKVSDKDKDHKYFKINCKNCHSCEYPTRQDPCLVNCPRKEYISVFHTPEESPEVFIINEMANRFSPVIFSHKIHAQMSEVVASCSGCHHYNTTGPVLSCKNCHEQNRYRADISKPDLEAAYHRQCMVCHRQWSHSNDCYYCHKKKGTYASVEEIDLKKLAGRNHPELKEPTRILFETSAKKGKYVTFYHNEHVKIFDLACVNCHKDNNCIKCHDSKNSSSTHYASADTFKIKKTFDEHHNPCSGCHETKINCDKCHMDKPMNPFNHAITAGWGLKSYHSKLSCDRCHKQTPYHKLNNDCNSCHNNFVKGKFDHKSIGLVLSASHTELDCSDCHIEKNFSQAPSCKNCHDDKEFPKFLPGKKNK